jgi:hypothetical protein
MHPIIWEILAGRVRESQGWREKRKEREREREREREGKKGRECVHANVAISFNCVGAKKLSWRPEMKDETIWKRLKTNSLNDGILSEIYI